MNISELIISVVFIMGIGSVLYLILRDPIYLFKSILRGLKSHPNLWARMILSPIWLPAWLIDKIFGLKLFIKKFEDASRPVKISFSNYDKYILINSTNLEYIKKVLHSFESDYNPTKFKYRLNGCEIKASEFGEKLVLKMENEIEFNSFNHLVHYLDNSISRDSLYNVKGILIDKNTKANSYFIFNDTAFSLKLIGKTFKNKKMYVDINSNTEVNDTIYFNSNMDFFKNFNFDNFEYEIHRLKFKEL
ncbi:hypothetical protein EYV94_25825 [Puteibacter caeruleilacunae]|nr:hypothetical protein EYV94_25825 [Puteibacter caeruleilacunae]